MFPKEQDWLILIREKHIYNKCVNHLKYICTKELNIFKDFNNNIYLFLQALLSHIHTESNYIGTSNYTNSSAISNYISTLNIEHQFCNNCIHFYRCNLITHGIYRSSDYYKDHIIYNIIGGNYKNFKIFNITDNNTWHSRNCQSYQLSFQNNFAGIHFTLDSPDKIESFFNLKKDKHYFGNDHTYEMYIYFLLYIIEHNLNIFFIPNGGLKNKNNYPLLYNNEIYKFNPATVRKRNPLTYQLNSSGWVLNPYKNMKYLYIKETPNNIFKPTIEHLEWLLWKAL